MFEDLDEIMRKRHSDRVRLKKIAQRKLDFSHQKNQEGLGSQKQGYSLCEMTQNQNGKSSKRGVFHEMHPAFQAVATLKPSMFNTASAEEEEEYKCATQNTPQLQKSPQKPQKKQRKIRRNLSSVKRKQFNDSDDSEDDEEQKITTRTARKRKMTMQNSKDDQIFKVFPSAQTFESKNLKQSLEHSDEPIKEERQASPPQREKLSSKKQQTFQINNHQQLLFFLDEQQSAPIPEIYSASKGPQQKRTEQLEPFKEKCEQVSENKEQDHILEPSERMLLRQSQITSLLFNFDKKMNTTAFLQQEIPRGGRLVFQGMVQNNAIFNRQYTFWLNGGQKKMLLMQAQKNVKLLQDYYLINQYSDQQRCYSFIAKMETNLQRRQFILSNQQQFSRHLDKFIIADINVRSQFYGKPQMMVFFPDFNHRTHEQKVVQIGTNQDLLKDLVKFKEQHISTLISDRFDPGLETGIMKQHNLIKTKKTIALVDKDKKIKLYIGKTESKRYKIIVGSGISPIIAFGVFIVLIQS